MCLQRFKLITLTYCQIYSMICIEVEIPQEICDIDDELKAIYHSRDSFCIWVFSTRVERNRFVEETIGMSKDQRQDHFNAFFQLFVTYVWVLEVLEAMCLQGVARHITPLSALHNAVKGVVRGLVKHCKTPPWQGLFLFSCVPVVSLREISTTPTLRIKEE